ncbi:MAG: hypothetical protein ACI4LX_05095 [Treponema sp.]
MNLTEILAATAVSVTAVSAFTGSLISVRQGIARSERKSESAVLLLETDSALRKKMRSIEIPYWKNFDAEFKSAKESLELFCAEKGIEGVFISQVYDRKHRAEGIKIEWNHDGKKHETQEFIKQRITDE